MVVNNLPTVRNMVVVPCFTSEECDHIVSSIDKWFEGRVVKFGSQIVNKDVRSVQIGETDLSEKILQNLFFKVLKTNNDVFRYHIEGFQEFDIPRVFKYSADRSDHYTWHTDLHSDGNICRKLSFSIQLSDSSDYEGGDLEFMPGITDRNARVKGAMILFSSFLTHRVTPITKGTRHCIVGWMQGPNFR